MSLPPHIVPLPQFFKPSTTLRAEAFAGRNFRDFRDFGPFSRKLMPGKNVDEKFAKVIFAKKKLFQKSRKFFPSLKNCKQEGNTKKSAEKRMYAFKTDK